MTANWINSKLQVGTQETRHATLHHGEACGECALSIKGAGLDAFMQPWQGPITSVRWRGGLVAWINSKGVKVVDVETYQKAARSQRAWYD